jgi:hypothetical protein
MLAAVVAAQKEVLALVAQQVLGTLALVAAQITLVQMPIATLVLAAAAGLVALLELAVTVVLAL